MADPRDDGLVDFDAERAVETGRDSAGDAFGACVEYTRDEFRVAYVSEAVESRYVDREQMLGHFETLMSYCYIDFSDRRLFERKLPAAGQVEYFLTRMDGGYFVRIITESQGLFVYLLPDAPVTETVEAMRDVVLETDTVEESPYVPD